MVKDTKFYDLLGVRYCPVHKLSLVCQSGENWQSGLQVPDTASEAQLKSAYKKGALKYHPGTLLDVQSLKKSMLCVCTDYSA